MKYTKKQITIEAQRVDDNSIYEVYDWITNSGGTCVLKRIEEEGVKEEDQTVEGLVIDTLEGAMTANMGDYVIRGEKGEFYPCKPDVFEMSYYPADLEEVAHKTLNNTTANQAKDQVNDLQIWGEGDMWKLICKASSKAEGWMKSTKAMVFDGGVFLQVTTQQGDNVAEAITFCPGARIFEQHNALGDVIGRKVSISHPGEGHQEIYP